MPRGKKLAVAMSVLVAGTSAALFFRKDASQLWFRQDAHAENPFFDRIERRATTDVSWSAPGIDGPAATPPRSAVRVMPATAAIVQPGGAPSGQPTFHRSLSPVAALLEPIDAVAPEADASDEPRGGLSPSAATPDGYVTHTITDGDTLSRLAGQYLGSSERYLEIYEANRDLLASPDLLPIGKVLKIPLRQFGAAPPGSRMPTADDDPSLRLVPLSR